jgi:hypothetical protein
MRAGFVGFVCAVVVAGCGSSGSAPARKDPAPTTIPPLRRGAWTFYGPGQGLSEDVQDVSADEGGNVYVAGGDALYVKRAPDDAFLRFDATNGGLTRNCNDLSDFFNETPAKPFYTCRILAVAGASAGTAIIGFDSFRIEAQTGASWTYQAGGADVVAFDQGKGTLAKKRHVWFASPPHTICTRPVYGRTATCDPTDYWWERGRRLVTRIRRLVVNHDRSSRRYGDVWAGGQHGTFQALLANAGARGLPDHTAGMGPEWADAKDAWEHLHPAETAPDGTFVNGEGWALSIDPRDGTVWGSNEYRTTQVEGYGDDLSSDDWWTGPTLDLWKDPLNTFFTAADDQVRSMSHCPDGTLWIGSLAHGLARIDPGGAISYPNLPAGASGVSAVACDPGDSSVWIGLAAGGVLRLRSGVFERLDTTGLPAFTANPVQSIQIDRWSGTRVVWFAFRPITNSEGDVVLAGGGVASFAGP